MLYIKNTSKSTKIRAYLPIKEEVLTNDNSAIKASKIEEIDVFKLYTRAIKALKHEQLKKQKNKLTL